MQSRFHRNRIDNPGWSVKIELHDTDLQDVKFAKVQVQREDENDWAIDTVEKGEFHGYGGPNNLNELLGIFLDWADLNK